MKRFHRQENSILKETRTLLITGISNEKDQSLIKLKLTEFGDLKETYTIAEKSILFAIFYDVRHSIAAKNGMNNLKIGDSEIKTHYTISKYEIPYENDQCDETRNQGTVLFVSRDFTAPLPDSEIEEILSVYGNIREIREFKIFQKYVEFCDSRSTIAAFNDFGEKKYKGGVLLLRYLWDMSKKMRWDMIRETDSILTNLEEIDKRKKKESDKNVILRAFDDFIAENIDAISNLTRNE